MFRHQFGHQLKPRLNHQSRYQLVLLYALVVERVNRVVVSVNPLNPVAERVGPAVVRASPVGKVGTTMIIINDRY